MPHREVRSHWVSGDWSSHSASKSLTHTDLTFSVVVKNLQYFYLPLLGKYGSLLVFVHLSCRDSNMFAEKCEGLLTCCEHEALKINSVYSDRSEHVGQENTLHI